jgi:murein L,D-transpeptidase YafK
MIKKTAVLILCATMFYTVQHLSAVDTSFAQNNVKKDDNAWKNENIGKINDFRALIHAWTTAWKSKDIERYMSFYNPAFRTKGFDYTGWLKRKSNLFLKPGKIDLEIFYLGVFVKNNYAYVSFIQRYQDAYHSDIGEKKMVLIHSNDNWSIVSEEWKPLGSDRDAQ